MFSDSGKYILTGSGGTVSIWQKDESGQWSSSSIPKGDTPESVVFSPDETRILTVADRQAWIWSKDHIGKWGARSYAYQGRRFRSAVFSPDGMQILLAATDGSVMIVDTSYLSGPIDWARHEAQSRVATICAERLSTSWSEKTSEETGEPHRVHPMRIITADDARAFPGIRHRVGEDVCANILKRPPWWRALVFWR